jgi:hypothetical protein
VGSSKKKKHHEIAWLGERAIGLYIRNIVELILQVLQLLLIQLYSNRNSTTDICSMCTITDRVDSLIFASNEYDNCTVYLVLYQR